jgi:hypothetical protein
MPTPLHDSALFAFLKKFATAGNQVHHAERIVGKDGVARYHPSIGVSGTRELSEHTGGTRVLGVYLVNGNLTKAGVYDLDDHEGNTGFDAVKSAARRLSDALIAVGMNPVVFRSGGGAGIHIWLLWEEWQPARDVRRFLHDVASSVGLRCGTGGVSAEQVEVFPKQDVVERGKFGNLIALPLARASVFLTRDELAPVDNAQLTPPTDEQLYSPVLPSQNEKSHFRPREEPLPGDEAEVQAALQYIPSGDYDTWVRVGFILKGALGNRGFDAWDQWSKTCPEKYSRTNDPRGKWGSFPERPSVGLGTLFHLAQQAGWNGPSDPLIREMNSRFGILTHGRTTRIIIKNGDREPDDEFWLSKETLADRLKGEDCRDKDGKRLDKASYWLNHPRTCHYHRVIFDPSREPGGHSRTWNLYRGLAVAAVPGNWDLLKRHILENICRNDQQLYDWLLNWMALGVQQPALVIGTAPVFVGMPGTGKGFLANMYGRIWGEHYTTITQQKHVTGNFNAHLAAKRFVFIDEGTFGGDRAAAGVLKARITEPYFLLEAKGVDAIRMVNRLIFMVASNEASVVPADRADRRWQMFLVSPAHADDRPYFKRIADQMDAGGTEGMLHDLLSRDLTQGPDPRKTIKNDALFDQVILAAPPEIRYIYQILDEGRLPQNDVAGPNSTTIKALFVDFQRSFPRSGFVSAIGLGRMLKSVIPGIQSKINGRYRTGIDKNGIVTSEASTRHTLPALGACREAFESHIGQKVPWSHPDAEWQSDDGAI